MRLGLITTSLDEDFTGIGEYTYQLAKGTLGLAREGGDELTFIHRLRKDIDVYREKGVNEMFVPYSKFGPIRYLKENTALVKHACEFDIIHEPFIGLYKKLECKMVVTLHDLTPVLFRNDAPKIYQYYFRYLMPRVLRNADRVIAVSQTTKNDIMRYYKISGENIEVIYNGVDKTKADKDCIESMKSKLLKNFGMKDENELKYILFVGTPVMRKNMPNALRAFAKLKKKGYPHKFVIAGRRGSDNAQILSTIKDCKLEGSVLFPGYMSKDEVRALYKLADLFVYPSLYEGFGLPPLEAMAQGTPALVSDRSVMPESVGDAGLIVAPDDVGKMAEAMERAVSDEKLRQELVEKGEKQCAKFDWSDTAKRTYALYKKVLEE